MLKPRPAPLLWPELVWSAPAARQAIGSAPAQSGLLPFRPTPAFIATMSDNWLIFIPANPSAVPTREAANRGVDVLKRFAPDARAVEARFLDKVEFVDCGSNWSGVYCPQCSEEIGEWWRTAIGNAYKSGFENLRIMTPCCGHSTTLNDLHYVWPSGFARFVLEAKSPNIKQTTTEQDKELSQALGVELRKIWRRL